MNFCFIEGLQLSNKSDTSYYYNERMLNEGIYISVEIIDDVDIVAQEEITVHVLSENERHFYEYTLYVGDILSGIQLHGILKNIYELYSSSPTVDKFCFILDDMALIYSTSNPHELEQPISKEDKELVGAALEKMLETLNYLKSQYD